MFADLFSTRNPAASDGYERAFVRSVRVTSIQPPDPRAARFLLVCWLVLAAKHALVLWAVARYPVPFNPLWVNAPTWLLATSATLLSYRRPE